MTRYRLMRNFFAALTATLIALIGFGTQAAVQPFGFDPVKHWYDLGTGAPISDTDWRKARGPFGGALVLTANIDVFLDRWIHMSLSQAPTIDAPPLIRRGDTVTAVLFYSGCGMSGDACQATVDFVVNKPDGALYGYVPGKVVPGGQAMSPGIVYVSPGFLSIRIDPTDPFGKYTVSAIVHETASAPPMTLKQTFEVVP